jgi:predicted nucleotidyltransferase
MKSPEPSMTVISVPSSRPIEPSKSEVLTRVMRVLGEWPKPPMLVGAFARDLWFWHVHGIETQRATEDIDISMALPDWNSFREVTLALINAGFSQPVASHPEKLQDSVTGRKIDLLPFGPISPDHKSIIWPSDQSRWSIVGLEDCYKNADVFDPNANSECRLRAATLPGLVVLKLVSFYERLMDRRRKDGADIGFTLAHYQHCGTKERLMSNEAMPIMDEVGGDILRASVHLLGRDMASIISKDTRQEIVDRLHREVYSGSQCPLAREVSIHVTRGRFSEARALLGDLLNGLESSGRE